jgi:predicted metal-binding protein
MDEIKIYEIADEQGFSAAMVIDTDDLQFVPEFRVFCEENDCGNYGKNYGCPPDCGTTQQMKERVLSFRKAVVFQSRAQVENLMDPAQTKPLKKDHINRTRRAMKRMEEEGMKMDGFAIMCGPCNFCSTCAIQEGKPCPHEDKRFSCLSAYCINATELAAHCGMEMQWGGNVASFFSMYVFDRK